MQQGDQVYEVVSEAPVRQERIFADVPRKGLIIERKCLYDDV